MLKAIANHEDGTKLLIIGLSFKDLELLRAKPLDDHIRIRGAQTGLPVDVMIFCGENEAVMMGIMSNAIGPDTKVLIDDKLKQ